MMPYSSRPKFSDLYTLSQNKLLENRTLHSGTYLYSHIYGNTPPPPPHPGLRGNVRASPKEKGNLPGVCKAGNTILKRSQHQIVEMHTF